MTDAITMQAMLLRYSAAVQEAQHQDLNGRIELLSQVVFPSEDVERASIRAAEMFGVSHLAKSMVRTRRAA